MYSFSLLAYIFHPVYRPTANQYLAQLSLPTVILLVDAENMSL